MDVEEQINTLKQMAANPMGQIEKKKFKPNPKGKEYKSFTE